VRSWLVALVGCALALLVALYLPRHELVVASGPDDALDLFAGFEADGWITGTGVAAGLAAILVALDRSRRAAGRG
jgi:Na+/proline symporter